MPQHNRYSSSTPRLLCGSTRLMQIESSLRCLAQPSHPSSYIQHLKIIRANDKIVGHTGSRLCLIVPFSSALCSWGSCTSMMTSQCPLLCARDAPDLSRNPSCLPTDLSKIYHLQFSQTSASIVRKCIPCRLIERVLLNIRTL